MLAALRLSGTGLGLGLLLAVGGIAVDSGVGARVGGHGAVAATNPDGRSGPETTITTVPADFSGTRQVAVNGTKELGNGVEVTLGATGARLCLVAADSTTTWACGVAGLPDGAGVTLTATEVTLPGTSKPTPGTTSLDVLGPPILDGAGSYLTTGLVSGTGRTGSTVSVSIEGTVDPNCTAVPVRGGSWSCNVQRPTGGPYVVRAQQMDPTIGGGRASAFSNVQNVTVDRDSPESAVIVSPLSEARFASGPLTVTGTGEDGASIDLYVDNDPRCSTIVRGTTWRCQVAGLPNGPRVVLAIQRDAAGNFADPSASIRVWMGPGPTTVTPTPTGQPSAPGQVAPPGASPTVPATPRATPTPSTQSPAPTPVPSAPNPTPGPSANDPLLFPNAQGGGGVPLSQALGNWGSLTGFGSKLVSLSGSASSGGWITAPFVAALFVLLIAAPSRLLATGLRGRMPAVRARLTGRNRPRFPSSPVENPSPWPARVGAVLVSALLVLLAAGVQGEARYVRLYLAVLVGLVILTLVSSAVARLAGRRFGATGTLTVLPLLIIGAAVTAIASRVIELDPPLVAGGVLAVTFTAGSTRARGLVSLLQVSALAGVGVAAWLVHGAVDALSGGWGLALSELLAALCLAGLGSALLQLMPIATLPGRAVLGWSPIVWVGSTAIVATITAGAVIGSSASLDRLVPWLFVGVSFAAVSLAVWAFARFVEPQPTALKRH